MGGATYFRKKKITCTKVVLGCKPWGEGTSGEKWSVLIDMALKRQGGQLGDVETLEETKGSSDSSLRVVLVMRGFGLGWQGMLCSDRIERRNYAVKELLD